MNMAGQDRFSVPLIRLKYQLLACEQECIRLFPPCALPVRDNSQLTH